MIIIILMILLQWDDADDTAHVQFVFCAWFKQFHASRFSYKCIQVATTTLENFWRWLITFIYKIAFQSKMQMCAFRYTCMTFAAMTLTMT